jgi:membrane-associated phospholipid phosphatase
MFFLLAACLLTGGCAAGPVPVWPDRLSWHNAVHDAVRDPATWAPAAGAVVVAAGGWDHHISRWAVRNTPVFGSVDDARRWSNRLNVATHAGMLLGALLPGDTDSSRFQRVLVGEAGVLAADMSSRILKHSTGRDRPNAADDQSFPSGHSTRSAASAAIAVRDLAQTKITPGARRALDTSLYLMSGATAWARVEAGVHYPTDVLAGMAIGNFVGRVVQNAWLGEHPPVVAIVPEPKGLSILVDIAW